MSDFGMHVMACAIDLHCELWVYERIKLLFFPLPRKDGIFLIRFGLLCV